MTCTQHDGLIICRPTCDAKRIVARDCPDCGKYSRFIALSYPWYGWSSTCLRCGRSFADGEWLPLDFVRQSRQKAIAAAKDNYRRTVVVPYDYEEQP